MDKRLTYEQDGLQDIIVSRIQDRDFLILSQGKNNMVVYPEMISALVTTIADKNKQFLSSSIEKPWPISMVEPTNKFDGNRDMVKTASILCFFDNTLLHILDEDEAGDKSKSIQLHIETLLKIGTGLSKLFSDNQAPDVDLP